MYSNFFINTKGMTARGGLKGMNGRKNLGKTILIGAAVVCIIIAFAIFIKSTDERATSISVNSLKDVTVQSSERINEIMNRAEKEILLTAALYEHMLESPNVTKEDLEVLTEESPFDYIEFVTTEGVHITENGNHKDSSDEVYCEDALKGHTGVSAVFDSKIAKENLVVFYTPLSYDNEILGVLTGIYKESQMKEMLHNTLFGEEARTILCDGEGNIIAGNSESEDAESVFDVGVFHRELSSDVQNELKVALLEGNEYEFQYEGTGGVGNACVTPLSKNGWMLIQTFPSTATAQIVRQSDRAGVQLLVELIIIFLVCLIGMQVTSYIQKKKLLKENKEQAYVVDGILRLFGTFVLVDLEQGTYRYLAGTKPRLSHFPSEGDYEQLKEYLLDNVKEEEEKERLAPLLEKENLQKSLNPDTTHVRYEYSIKNSEGMWDSLNLICASRVGGVATEVLFTYQDVTAVKKRELESYEALKEAYKAVESANRAKSAFLSNMSHDIRTPMNAIIGMTAIAGTHLNDSERVADCLQKITVSSKHLLGLINEVLDMSKIESGKVDLTEEDFDLSELIDNLLVMVKPQIDQRNQDLIVNINGVTHENVIGDSLRIQQVFMNLMSNAIKYTPNGGKIHLSITEKKVNQKKTALYEVVVEDSGIGMSKEFLGKIFEPFARAQDNRVEKMQGTGLGMPIARNIARMMGGDIRVESQQDVGSKFTVTFFLKLQDEDEVGYAEFIDLPVLVADDDEISCESACEMLNEMGMKSEWVLSGREAVDLVVERQNMQKGFFAVILDWKMPDMDGVATTKEIRRIVGNDVPIIIISAYDWSDIEQEARKAGANAFIGKPLFKSKIVHLFRSLVGDSGEGEEEKSMPLTELEEMNLEGKRILLVEDNEINTEVATEILGMTGVAIECSPNGSDAVDKITSAEDGYYDMILMDIQMPIMNGYEAASAIRSMDRAYTKKVPIIAMTANAFAEDIMAAKSVGMNGHIAKPLDLEQIVKALKKWL
jgi:signal transduction histidine kinase/CheY-like chemotaxis protein